VTSDLGRLDGPFMVASSISLDVLRCPAVADCWDQPSVLPKMSVGALACHLGRQVVRAVEQLPALTELPELDSVDAHYHRSAWVRSTSPDDPVNDRSSVDAEAAQGAAVLVTRTASALDSVRRLLASGAARDVVPVPWQGWSLSRPDFLLTRLLETVVHTDDLALSVGAPTPEFPEEVFLPVRDLLVRLAVDRHGQSAVIGTLARAERTRVISAF
jgi:hypothetical protein